MKIPVKEIVSWIEKLSDLELESPKDAYQMFLKNKEFSVQAFEDGIKPYDLEVTIIKILLDTGHFNEALSFIEGKDEFKRNIVKNRFFPILETVFEETHRAPNWREIAKGLINITKNDPHWCFMSLGLEIDFDLYGSPEEYTAALKKIDAVLEKPPAFSFDSRYDSDIIAFKACVAAAIRHDFEIAGKYMQVMIKSNPKSMVKLNFEIKNNEKLEDFKKSIFFKQVKPLQPKDKFLQSAYDNSEDEPYKVFQNLEKKKQDSNDLADLISVQHYCISLICSDLDEHGESNIEEYGKGKISPKEFKKIKKDLELELKDLMKKEKIKQTLFWQYKNFKSFKEIPF